MPAEPATVEDRRDAVGEEELTRDQPRSISGRRVLEPGGDLARIGRPDPRIVERRGIDVEDPARPTGHTQENARGATAGRRLDVRPLSRVSEVGDLAEPAAFLRFEAHIGAARQIQAVERRLEFERAPVEGRGQRQHATLEVVTDLPVLGHLLSQAVSDLH